MPATRLVQPDPRSCGAACLVRSHMLHDPAYDAWVRAGTGRFAAEVLATHRRTNRARTGDGRLQVPWPRALGTAPWAIAREMSSDAGSGRPDTRHRVVWLPPALREAAFAAATRALAGGHTVPLYVGNRLAPAHVVLATGSDDAGWRVHDPADGRERPVSRTAFVEGRLPFHRPTPPLDRAGPMTLPWCVVLPR